MDRPEEIKLYTCPECARWAEWTDGRTTETGDKTAEFWCQICGAESPLDACERTTLAEALSMIGTNIATLEKDLADERERRRYLLYVGRLHEIPTRLLGEFAGMTGPGVWMALDGWRPEDPDAGEERVKAPQAGLRSDAR